MYKEVCNKLQNIHIDNEEEQEQLKFDFELELFEDVNINLKYLLELTQKGLINNEKKETLEKIENFDIPKEIRQSLKDVVSDYEINSAQDVYELLKNDLSNKINIDLEHYAKGKEIEDIERFKKIAYKQMCANISKSNNVEYSKLKGNWGFKEKVDFKDETFDKVLEIQTTYDLERFK